MDVSVHNLLNVNSVSFLPIPITHSMGSANRKYKTLTSDINDFAIPNHIHQYIADPSVSTTWTEAPEHWLQRAVTEDFLYLMGQSPPGARHQAW